jgi:hypothetical protein
MPQRSLESAYIQGIEGGTSSTPTSSHSSGCSVMPSKAREFAGRSYEGKIPTWQQIRIERSRTWSKAVPDSNKVPPKTGDKTIHKTPWTYSPWRRLQRDWVSHRMRSVNVLHAGPYVMIRTPRDVLSYTCTLLRKSPRPSKTMGETRVPRRLKTTDKTSTLVALKTR